MAMKFWALSCFYKLNFVSQQEANEYRLHIISGKMRLQGRGLTLIWAWWLSGKFSA